MKFTIGTRTAVSGHGPSYETKYASQYNPRLAAALKAKEAALLSWRGVSAKRVLASRRASEQIAKALEFLDRRDLSNCRTSLVVAQEWSEVMREVARG